MKTHNIVYQITNKLNGKIYRGVHSTDNIEDGYMGSGINIKRAIEKYGKENFIKDVLFDFSDKIQAFKKEKEIVNENFVNKNSTYNMKLGGCGGWESKGKSIMKNKKGDMFYVDIKDPRILSGELVGIFKDMVSVRDKHNNLFHLNKRDPRILSGELKHISTGKVVVKDDKGNILKVNQNNPKVLSGELVGINKNKRRIYKDKINKSVKIEEVQKWLDDGWKFGIFKKIVNRKWINKYDNEILVPKEDLEKWFKDDWQMGRKRIR